MTENFEQDHDKDVVANKHLAGLQREGYSAQHVKLQNINDMRTEEEDIVNPEDFYDESKEILDDATAISNVLEIFGYYNVNGLIKYNIIDPQTMELTITGYRDLLANLKYKEENNFSNNANEKARYENNKNIIQTWRDNKDNNLLKNSFALIGITSDNIGKIKGSVMRQASKSTIAREVTTGEMKQELEKLSQDKEYVSIRQLIKENPELKEYKDTFKRIYDNDKSQPDWHEMITYNEGDGMITIISHSGIEGFYYKQYGYNNDYLNNSKK